MTSKARTEFIPPAQGLYDPKYEHENCGMGFVVDMKGRRSHEIVRDALEICVNLDHRGGCGCDPITGDGAGIQVEIAPDFFKEKILATGHTTDEKNRICVGMVFLPRTDYADQEK